MAKPTNPARFCFGCGPENPRGLGLEFRTDGGRAVSEFVVPDYLQGFPGYAHGGGVATMLDEAMGWACYGQGVWAMTARFSMRMRDSVPLGEHLVVSGEVVRDRGQFLQMRAELRSAAGKLFAEADGTFVRLRGKQAEEIKRRYEGPGRPAG
jgi:acyl-coenzyme A thioesterase PaaI-like protein